MLCFSVVCDIVDRRLLLVRVEIYHEIWFKGIEVRCSILIPTCCFLEDNFWIEDFYCSWVEIFLVHQYHKGFSESSFLEGSQKWKLISWEQNFDSFLRDEIDLCCILFVHSRNFSQPKNHLFHNPRNNLTPTLISRPLLPLLPTTSLEAKETPSNTRMLTPAVPYCRNDGHVHRVDKSVCLLSRATHCAPFPDPVLG